MVPFLTSSPESFGWKEGLDKKFHKAKAFYIIIAISLILGLSLNYIGISPIKALIYSAILYGLTAPVLIAIILHISNNKKIMGKYTNGKTSNILGFATLVLMTVAAVILVYMQLTEKRRHACIRKRYKIIVGSATDMRDGLLYHECRGNNIAFTIESLPLRAYSYTSTFCSDCYSKSGRHTGCHANRGIR